ncbi:hypothetical protein I302_106785 [Kwoniella bestiolae CBS 10118]|uniref:Uncharacterized protein n=1 Tax=Kwoniella bestiolae CBS 10118 TaxID=1296100 RepID=A0A1B9G0E8_9TREE|nr:hypothetical protein I302_05950 [Kwoniella bestiolae CBS 10118]OCF24490.1 hypothetical protein I302_05950 [Kwoniella bestiolae CBS 10118]
MTNDPNDPSTKAMVKSTPRVQPQMPGQGNFANQANSVKLPQDPRIHQGPKNANQQGIPSSQGRPSNSQEVRHDLGRGTASSSNQVIHAGKPTNQGIGTHQPVKAPELAANRGGQAQSSLPPANKQVNPNASAQPANHNSALPRGEVRGGQGNVGAAQTHRGDKNNKPPPPGHEMKQPPRTNVQQSSNDLHRPAQPSRPPSREPKAIGNQMFQSQAYPNNDDQDEEYDELGDDIDDFGKEMEDRLFAEFSQHSTDAEQFSRDYSRGSNDRLPQSQYLHTSTSANAKGTANQFAFDQPLYGRHPPSYLERKAEPPVRPIVKTPARSYDLKPLPGGLSFDDELAQDTQGNADMREAVFTYQNSGVPVTPDRNGRGDISTFNFTPSAKDSDSGRQVVLEPEPELEPRFKIPMELQNHHNLAEIFVDHEQVFQDMMKSTKVAEFRPAWVDVKDGYKDLGSKVNVAHHQWEEVQNSLSKLIEIKDNELKRKINLTGRYVEAGSDLSEHCNTMQRATRNNVKRPKVEMEVY